MKSIKHTLTSPSRQKLDLVNVHQHEEVTVTFTADEDWSGEFALTVFSATKNSSNVLAITVVKQKNFV